MRLSRLISLLLVLALGVTTLGYGFARGQAPAAGTMVLCTGSGIVTVTVDAHGNPVESHTLCPDAALTFLAGALAEPPLALAFRASAVRLDWRQEAQARTFGARVILGARAPPVAV